MLVAGTAVGEVPASLLLGDVPGAARVTADNAHARSSELPPQLVTLRGRRPPRIFRKGYERVQVWRAALMTLDGEGHRQVPACFAGERIEPRAVDHDTSGNLNVRVTNQCHGAKLWTNAPALSQRCQAAVPRRGADRCTFGGSAIATAFSGAVRVALGLAAIHGGEHVFAGLAFGAAFDASGGKAHLRGDLHGRIHRVFRARATIVSGRRT